MGVVSRFVPQKGLDLLAEVIESMLANMRVQFVILGAAIKHRRASSRLAGALSGQGGAISATTMRTRTGSRPAAISSHAVALRAVRAEPDLLGQVRHAADRARHRRAGGDRRAVRRSQRDGTGFKFWEPSANALYYTVGWAVSTYYDRREHINGMVQAAMKQDYSWERSARAYEAAYERAKRKAVRGR